MLTWDSFRFLAETAFGEARGEGFEGMRMVAHVIINRTKDDRWPDGIRDVVLQRYQFSCWNRDDPNRRTILATDLTNPTMRMAARAALAAIERPDITDGANHYHADHVHPEWADKMTETVRHGKHIFFRG